MKIDHPESNHRVLVIDDMPEVHTLFRKLLAPKRKAVDLPLESSLFGPGADNAAHADVAFEVDSALQGAEGSTMVRSALAEGRPYAMAFIDMRMPPGWDGLQTIQAIWTDDPDLEVVICTAFSDYSDRDIFERLGPSDQVLFLRKPFEVIEARQLARALTEKWSLRQQSRLRFAGLERGLATRTRQLSAISVRLGDEAKQNEAHDLELRDAKQLETLGRLAAGVSVELDASLQLLAAALGDARRSAPEPAGPPGPLDTAIQATHRLTGLVRGLMQVAAKAPPPHASIDLNDALGSVIEVMREGIRDCSALDTNFGILPRIPCAPADIDLVLFGIIDNAVQAADVVKHKTGRNGRISISTRAENGYGVVAISDTGEPVSDELRMRIFEPFFTAGAGERHGLALAWRIIVEQHGGKLTLENPASGGSTVCISLPLGGSAGIAAV